jgi:hypothetical protein
VQGKIELGDQIARVIRDINESGVQFDEGTVKNLVAKFSPNIANMLYGGDSEIDPKRKGKKRERKRDVLKLNDAIPYLDKDAQADAASESIKGEMSLLDEMVHNREENAHVYGHHKKGKRDRPLNNIIV